MTGSIDDHRRTGGPPPGDEPSVTPDGRCPRCGRALADEACLHCAVADELRGGSLVRSFVTFPDLYASDPSSPPGADAGTGGWPPRPDTTRTPDPDATTAPAGSGAPSHRAATVAPSGPSRRRRDATGWGPRGILAKTLIATGSILLAALIGIAGAVFTGPARDSAGPSGATPTAADAAGQPSTGARSETPRPPAAGPVPTGSGEASGVRAVTGAIVQGPVCLDDYASGTGNGNPVHLWACDDTDAQRWTFATDGTVRVFGRCMRPIGGAVAYGTRLELWRCDGTASQQWLRGPDESLVHPASGACLENPAPDDPHGARPWLAPCGDTPGQRWRLPYAGLSS